MAAPQVTAVAAMMRVLNPYATLRDLLRTLKLTAQRPRGSGFSNDLGWGILNAGAALSAVRRIDRIPPVSHVHAPRTAHSRAIRISWNGHDAHPAGLIASGIKRFNVYVALAGHHRRRLLARTRHHSLIFHGLPGRRYVFYVVAIDREGNRQHPAAKATTKVAAGAH
jgi:hypothetical protein